MTFVNYQQEVVRKVVKQSLRSTSRRSACKNSRVVLNAAAIADFTQHFHVIVGALFDSLSLDKLVVLREVIHPLIEFAFYFSKRRFYFFVTDNVVRGREDSRVRDS